MLFDAGCGLAAQSWGVTASVSVDGYLLASPSFAAYPNGYLRAGTRRREGISGSSSRMAATRSRSSCPSIPGWATEGPSRHTPDATARPPPAGTVSAIPPVSAAAPPSRAGIDNEAAWEAFRAEAESWLGTPYRHLQRCRGRGADCTLFVGQALLDAGLLTRLEYDYYPRDWHEHTRDEYVLEASHRHMRDYLRPGLEMASLPVGTPLLRGDWLAFSTTERRVTNHCGLVWPCADGGFQMLHAINDRGVSFTPLGNWWLRRMTRHFRIVIAEAEVAAWA